MLYTFLLCALAALFLVFFQLSRFTSRDARTRLIARERQSALLGEYSISALTVWQRRHTKSTASRGRQLELFLRFQCFSLTFGLLHAREAARKVAEKMAKSTCQEVLFAFEREAYPFHKSMCSKERENSPLGQVLSSIAEEKRFATTFCWQSLEAHVHPDP